MLLQDGLQEQVKRVTFDTDTGRTLSFRMYSDPTESSADIIYEITSPGVSFDNGTKQVRRSKVRVPTGGLKVSTPVVFVKTGSGPVFQIDVTATVTEAGGGVAFRVDWVISVVQTSDPTDKLLAVSVDASSADEVERSDPDPLDRAELEHAARVLRTLQALVERALNDDAGGES